MVAQRTQELLVTLASQESNVALLLQLPVLETVCAMSAAHPLNDAMHLLVGRTLTAMQLSKEEAQIVLKRGGGRLLVKAVEALMATEQPLAEALQACGQARDWLNGRYIDLMEIRVLCLLLW